MDDTAIYNGEKVILEKNNEEVECDVLFTFDCEDTMRSYVGYTDHSMGKNGRKNIYVSSYSPFDKKQELVNVTDERELAMIAEVLEEIDESTEQKSK